MIAVSIIGIFEAYAISTQSTAGDTGPSRKANKSYAVDLAGIGYGATAIY